MKARPAPASGILHGRAGMRVEGPGVLVDLAEQHLAYVEAQDGLKVACLAALIWYTGGPVKLVKESTQR